MTTLLADFYPPSPNVTRRHKRPDPLK